MYIITVASTKGGVGKSTFILNLATLMVSKGKKVVILDADTQGTISKWSRLREHMIGQGDKLPELFIVSARGKALLDIAANKKHEGYFVLIDSPGVDDENMRAALLRSDFVITPCPPSPPDLWEVETLANIIKKLKITQNRVIPLLLLFTKVPTRHSKLAIEDSKTFFENNNMSIHSIINSVIKERVAFKNSIRDGRGVVEYSTPDSKAVREIEGCYEEIVSIIKDNNSTTKQGE